MNSQAGAANQAEVAHKWYRLDNAANVYPAIRNRRRPEMFRVSATLREPVDPQLLQQAVNTVLKRIPSFSVTMRSGLFWHYFSHSDDTIQVQDDASIPFMGPLAEKDNGFQIRVRAHDRRIALEVFHSVSDGSGALVFLKTTLAQYLGLRGSPVPATLGILNCAEPTRLEEVADDFSEFAGSGTPRPRRQRRAYHISGTKLAHHGLEILKGTLPVAGVKKQSDRYGVSITEYLTGILIYVLNNAQNAEQTRHPRPVRVQVPVNLRRFHPTDTLRNFSSYVCPEIDPTHGDYTFEEILSLVHHFMRYEITTKNLRSRVATNIRTERNLLVRMMPLFIKNRVISLGYRLTGPAIYSTALSNLGLIRVPPEMAAHVEMFDFNLGASHVTNVNCAMLGYDGKLRIDFTRVIEEPAVEKAFFTFLVQQGVHVKVERDRV